MKQVNMLRRHVLSSLVPFPFHSSRLARLPLFSQVEEFHLKQLLSGSSLALVEVIATFKRLGSDLSTRIIASL